ncbi:MAG: hypothetical protein WDM77_20770 [Steroidobacteraceae bacterium]
MLTLRPPMGLLAVLLVATLAHAQTHTPAPAAAAASSAPAAAHAGKRPATTAAPLDLHAPPLNHLYASSELRYILAADDSAEDSATEVSVKGTRLSSAVPGTPGNQLQAIPWALMHPTQAWRIFTPLVTP